MSDHQFKLQINFTKSYVDQDGNHCLEGVASGPEVDLTDERMSPEALKSMVSSIRRRLIEFRDAHKQEWNDDLGEVVELSLDESNHLIYRSVLDMNLSGSKDLWYRVHTLGKKYGVSIGGAVLKAGMEYVADLGRQVYTYFDVDLYEISITRQAAYQYSFANAVLKSLPMKEEPMQKNQENQDEQTETQTSTTGGESVTTSTNDTLAEETVAAEDQSDATETQEQTEAEEVESEATEEQAAADKADAEISDAGETAEEQGAEVEKSTEAEESSTEAVAKSAAFGDWAEIGLVTGSIERLTWTLQDHVWNALYDNEKTTAEKLSTITDGLDDFKTLILKVATALVEDTNTEEVKRAVEAFKATSPDAVAKSLTEKDAKVEELTKSLTEATTELETTKESLAQKETELEKINTRKGMVFDKFTGHEASKDTQEEVVKASNEQFASFIITGAR